MKSASAQLQTFDPYDIIRIMSAFTPLEHAALAAILDEMVEHRAIIEQQLDHAVVLSRENTGGGFFTDLEAGTRTESLDRKVAPLGQRVWMGIDGLDYGLGMILHLREGRASLLEGYAVGAEDTSKIDFAHVRFAIAGEPGPLPTNVR